MLVTILTKQPVLMQSGAINSKKWQSTCLALLSSWWKQPWPKKTKTTLNMLEANFWTLVQEKQKKQTTCVARLTSRWKQLWPKKRKQQSMCWYQFYQNNQYATAMSGASKKRRNNKQPLWHGCCHPGGNSRSNNKNLLETILLHTNLCAVECSNHLTQAATNWRREKGKNKESNLFGTQIKASNFCNRCLRSDSAKCQMHVVYCMYHTGNTSRPTRLPM